MKKFLVFLVSLVVVVCVGLTTYYFMRNNEIITIKTKEIYCNAGDTIPLESLGIKVEKANVSKKTTFNYNAGGENVTKYIEFDAESQAYVVSHDNAGEVTLVIRTSNKKYGDFKINVHIGNGTATNPYYIFNESQLLKIGSTYRLDSHYRLMNDITLTSNFKPIGYNYNTNEWTDFNGSFDGQGYSIKGLNLNNVESSNAGFFSSLGGNSVVKNLTIENATIIGSHSSVGVLAGIAKGSVDKVVIKNSTITNTANASNNGSLVGLFIGSNLKTSYAENVTLNVGTDASSQSVVGGLVGYLNQTTVQACYANNVTLNITNSTVPAGGFVGCFEIGTETGSIQQSYANATSTYANFGAFVGEIKTADGFDLTKANMLRHLIGNFVIVYGKVTQAEIADTDLVKAYNADFFKNAKYVGNSAFFDNGESALYLVRGFVSASEVIATNEFIYYAIDMNTIENWDTTYVWDITNNSLPILRMGSVEPTQPSGDYFRRDLAEKALGNTDTFKDVFKANVADQNITILDNMDLTSGWTPVSVTNTTIDGNGKTISINLNNAVDGNLGLFTVLDNVTIKNLNIVVTGVSANSTNAGALAGIIKSSDALTTSKIENVTITYNNFATPIITNFGGLAGSVEKTNIHNVSVSNLVVNNDAKISNAGVIAGTINGAVETANCQVTASTIIASENVGAVAGINNGTLKLITGDATVKLNASVDNANVGGFVGVNNGTIADIWISANVEVVNAQQNANVGGVAGVNNGTISYVESRGAGVTINSAIDKTIYVGGLTAVNNGTIENTINSMVKVGSYVSGKNHIVGGVVAVNNGTISKVVTQSNLEGNIVSGVVAQMNNSKAIIDQVVVGKFDSTSQLLSKNEIKGDKYLAGVVVDFKAGTITNVQASSKIVGESSSTRASLIALIFPYGANLKNATINSSFSGYFVSTYRETWTDFASYDNKAEFGLTNGETGDERFNLYKYDTFHGIMQSVVINTTNDGVADAKIAMGSAFAWGKDYQDTEDSSFIKYVEGFSDVSQFQGSFEFVCATSSWFGIKHKATKTLTFEIGAEWCSSNNGISLSCLWDLFNI